MTALLANALSRALGNLVNSFTIARWANVVASSVVAVLKIVRADVQYLALESHVVINCSVRKMNAVLLIKNVRPVVLETSVIQMTTVPRVTFVAIVQAMSLVNVPNRVLQSHVKTVNIVNPPSFAVVCILIRLVP